MHGDLGFQNNDCVPGTFKEECCGIDSERALEKSIKERGGIVTDSDSTVCLENCQAPCDRLIFKTSARASTWPSTRYVKKLAIQYEGDMNGDDSSTVSSLKDTLRSEVSAVSIYLNSMNIIHVENGVAFGVSSLFGSIGGTLGLFIGFSIITVVELLDFIMVFFWLIMKRTASTASKLEKASEEKIRQSVQTNISKTKIGISVVDPRGGEQEQEQEQEQELSATELMSWTKKKENQPPPPSLPPPTVNEIIKDENGTDSGVAMSDASNVVDIDILEEATDLLNSLPSLVGEVDSATTTPIQVVADEADENGKVLGTCVAMYDFITDGKNGELALKKGDVISVTELDNSDGWWHGTLNGSWGSFPFGYVYCHFKKMKQNFCCCHEIGQSTSPRETNQS